MISFPNVKLPQCTDHSRPINDWAYSATSVLFHLNSSPDIFGPLSRIVRFSHYLNSRDTPAHEDLTVAGHLTCTLRITLELAQPAMSLQELNAEEASLLSMAAVVHDVPELAFLEDGHDVNSVLKTAAHNELEARYLKANFTRLFGNLDEDTRQKIETAFSDIVYPGTQAKNAKLVNFFELIERLGYLDTAISIFARRPERINTDWLTLSVLHRQLAKLEELIAQFPSSKIFIFARQDALEAALYRYEQTPRIIENARKMEMKTFGVELPFFDSFGELATRYRNLAALPALSKSF